LPDDLLNIQIAMRKARKTRRQVLFFDVVDAWVPEEGRSLKVIHPLVAGSSAWSPSRSGEKKKARKRGNAFV
jgi:hypothetical protein